MGEAEFVSGRSARKYSPLRYVAVSFTVTVAVFVAAPMMSTLPETVRWLYWFTSFTV